MVEYVCLITNEPCNTRVGHCFLCPCYKNILNEKEMGDLIDKWFDETIRIPTGDIRCSGDFTWDELVSLGLWLEKHFRLGMAKNVY